MLWAVKEIRSSIVKLYTEKPLYIGDKPDEGSGYWTGEVDTFIGYFPVDEFPFIEDNKPVKVGFIQRN